MKTHLLSFLIIVVYLGVGGSQKTNAQADSLSADLFALTFEELMDVKVKGISKKLEDLNKTPMSVYLLTNEEMKKWGVRSLYEVLGRVPGYNYYYTDNYGQFGVIGRGMSSIWRYGMGFEFLELNDFGHYILSPNFFKNVEIARGPAGLAWGGNAEAGLINFNIRDDMDGAELHTQFGNYNRFAADVLIGNKFEKEGDGFFIGFHYEQQDYENVPNNLGVFHRDTVPYIKMNGINPSWSILTKYKKDGFKFILFKDHSDHVTPHLWSWNDPGQIAFFDTLKKKNGEFHDEFETIAMRGEYNFFHNRSSIDLTLFSQYYHRHWFVVGLASINQRRYTVGFNFRKNLLNDKLDVSAGGDLYSKEISHDPNNNSYKATQFGFNWYENIYFPQCDEYSNIYAQGNLNLTDYVTLIGGGRVEYQKHDKHQDIIFSGPRAGIIVHPLHNLTLKLLYNKSERLPSGNEVSEANRAEPENLAVKEFVAMYDIDKLLNASVTVFHQKLKDRIFNIIEEDHAGFANGGGIESYGVEWNVKYYPMGILMLFANGHFHHSEAISTTYLSHSYSFPKLSDNRLPFSPEFSNFLGGEVKLFNFLNANLAWRNIAKIPYFELNESEHEITVNYFDMSFRTNAFFKNRLTASVNVINVFDNQKEVPAFGEHLQNSNGTVQPEGRRFFLTLSYKLQD